VYGPRQTYGPYSGVITIFINRLLKNEPPIIYGDGEQTRDFVHVQDVVEANMLSLVKKTAVGEVLNIATGTPTTINQLAAMLQKVMKTNLKPSSGSLLCDICSTIFY
jgi:UDP-glucose 4-epimerase